MKKFTRKSSLVSVNTSDAQANQAYPLKPLAAWLRHPLNWSLLAGALPVLAFAQVPTGGSVAAGSATITTHDANNMQVQQSTNKAIYNWQQFSIGNNGTVQFVQPNSSSIALNRVVGSDPSSILGRLSSNGQIFLVNPNGIFFGANAAVDVAGIVATTMSISDADFMRGDYRFTRGPNTPAGATVINAGSIDAHGGYVVLAGDYAANSGVLQVQLGTALLASGNALTLQLAGSSLINYAVDQATVAHLAGVANSGQILANGGRVIMTADVANDLASTVVNNSGLIQAQSVVNKDGGVYLAGNGGNVVNSGTLDASAQPGANGGHVAIKATGDISHEAGSKINVSGADTGISTAGSVNTWADGTNNFKAGADIQARGGAEGGNGGFVELSGKKVINRSLVDLRAPNGELGTLLLDPNAITIADGAGADAGDQSTVYEQNVEAQMKLGNYALSATGPNASITLASLTDGVLDGSNNGNGGSLTLSASGTGAPNISFADATNTIKVDRGLTFSVDNGSGSNAVGSMNIGNLEAGTAIDLKAGSISTGNLSISKSINTSTDTSYSIAAHAYSGDLTVNGDAVIDISNTTAASVETDMQLIATGDVNVTGNVASKATGLGYHNYNWSTAGSAAPTYYGNQPWTLNSQGDHPVTANLNIQAGGNVSTGAIDVLSTDNNTAFATYGVGGYWQTATSTQHNFWRPTATQATATVNASGNVTVNGQATVKADGYATSDYSEVESWRQMVNNYNYTSGNQTVHTGYGCLGYSNGNCTGGYGYTSSYVHTENDLKGSSKGNYIWEFGPYTSSLPSHANDSPDVTKTSDYNEGTNAGPMSYSNVAGMKATLDITASGSVTMNGMSVTSTNRSGTGGDSYTDANWGRQDTAGGLNNTTSSFTSASREIDYFDTFSTSFTAATSTATVNITAGDNQSVNLNGGAGVAYDVIASHPELSDSSNTLASASMKITAGTSTGAMGAGHINLNGPIHVEGADDASVSLTVLNHDGAITQANSDAAIIVKNNYYGDDATASFTSDVGNVTLDDVAVTTGRGAYLNVVADQNLASAGNLSATGTNRAEVNLTANNGTVVAEGTVGAAASSGIALVNMTADGAITTNNNVSAGSSTQANVNFNSSDSITTNDTLSAIASNGTGLANVTLTATNGVEVNGGITSQATNSSVTYLGGLDYAVDGGTASVNITSNSGNVDVNSDVTVTAYKNASINGTADGALSVAAAKSVAASASGSSYPDNYSYSYATDVSLTAGAGLSLDGNVVSTTTNGTSTVGLTTTGGSAASITQGTGGLVKANGVTATVTVKAGDAAPNASNAATIALAGELQAKGTTGTATLNVDAKSGSINSINAISTGNAATADIKALDGSLTLSGISQVKGNTNSNDGAKLTVTGTDSLDSSTAAFTVVNSNTGVSAGAQGSFTANNGTNKVGGASVTGHNTASVSVSGADAVTVNGALWATTNAASGNAHVDVTSIDDAVTVAASPGSATATTNGANSNATVNLTGVTGLNVDGNVTASGTTASVNLLTTGGNTAAINQGANSTVLATGTTASVIVNAGAPSVDATNGAAIALGGAMQANATTGKAALEIAAKSGSVKNFTVTSNSNEAGAFITTYGNGNAGSGTLTLNGIGSVSGSKDSSAGVALTATTTDGAIDASTSMLSVTNTNTGSAADAVATITANGGNNSLGGVSATTSGIGTTALAHVDASTAGTLSVSGPVSATANGSAAVAKVDLMSTAGALNINNALASVSATAGNNGGVASVNLISVTGMTVNGNLTATAETAQVNVLTTGGNTASITQGANSIIKSAGNTATTMVAAGNATPGATNAAVLALGGMTRADAIAGTAVVNIQGKSGTVHDVSTISTGNTALATIKTFDQGGTLTVNGTGTVNGNYNSVDGAKLVLDSAGGIDNGAGTTAIINSNTGSTAGATEFISALNGAATLGAINVSGKNAAGIIGYSTGNMSLRKAVSTAANGASGTAAVSLIAGGTLTVDGSPASIAVNASGTDSQALVQLSGIASMAINGNITATGTTASADFKTVGGNSAAVSQGAGSTILANGVNGSISFNAGAATPDSTNGAAVTLNGDNQVRSSTGTAALAINGGSGAIKNFSAVSTGNAASAKINAYNGAFGMNGTGTVNGNTNTALGANVTVNSAGSINAGNSVLNVANSDTGNLAGAQASLAANNGSAQLGQISVTGYGKGGTAIVASASDSMGLNGNLSAFGLGIGNALVKLTATGRDAPGSALTQASGTTVLATTNSPASDATVNVEAVNSTVALGGSVEATVKAGSGNAGVTLRGNQISVKDAKAVAMGSGNASLAIAAPAEIKMTGKLTAQAADSSKRADIQLISDRLTDNGMTTAMSTGNSHIQLASFDVNKLIGVDDDRDFDAVPVTNYPLATLQKFTGNQTEIKFGGEYDRSAWGNSNLQQTAHIHVAGNGHLDLGDVKMVFDTLGTTYYHDTNMSPWSVPTGRLALFVTRPNVDRYLDRTENALQTLTKGIENASFARVNAPADNGAMTSGYTRIQGNLFMAGEGVNTGSYNVSGGEKGTTGNANGATNSNGKRPTGEQSSNTSQEEQKSGKDKENS